MPVLDVIRASVEAALSFALKADPESEVRLRRVNGKSFRLSLTELPEPVTMVFLADGVSLMGPAYEHVDCELKLSLADASVLSDPALVTEAIRSGEIGLIGDPATAQQAASVFTGLDIDWEELLSGYVGDVPGFLVARGINRLRSMLPARKAVERRISEILTDDSRVLAHPLQLELLEADIHDLDSQIVRMEQQLNQLESD